MILNLGNKNKIGSSTISQFNYTNDELGRRIKRVDTTSGVLSTNSFDYNQRSEVTSALMSTNTYAYNYDDIGNRVDLTTNLSNQTNTCAYVVNELNQYTNISCSVGSTTQSPVYDNDGNMLSYNNWSFTWNAENRLIVASNSTTVVHYAYDYQGRMFEKVTDGTQTAFVWNGNRIVREMKTSPTLSVTYSYIWGAEGTPLAMTDSINTFFYCLDANKNVTELVDSNGSSVAYYEYSPFGVTTLSIGSLAQTNPFRFSSEYFDSTTDFIHYKYRVYVPQLGRWLSCDPIGERGGWNLYGFIDNDGINYFDNFGLYVILCFAYKEGEIVGFDKDDSKKTIKIKDVFSGNNLDSNNPNSQHLEDKGPIPVGEYWLGMEYMHKNTSNGDWEWFKLWGDDGNGGKSYVSIPVKHDNQTIYRGGFNLHTGRASDGCVTCRSDVAREDVNYPKSKEYSKLKKFIKSSKTLFKNPRNKADTYRGIFLVEKCVSDCEKAMEKYKK